MANLSKPEPVEKLEDEEYSMPDDDSQQTISKIEPVVEAATKVILPCARIVLSTVFRSRGGKWYCDLTTELSRVPAGAWLERANPPWLATTAYLVSPQKREVQAGLCKDDERNHYSGRSASDCSFDTSTTVAVRSRRRCCRVAVSLGRRASKTEDSTAQAGDSCDRIETGAEPTCGKRS